MITENTSTLSLPSFAVSKLKDYAAFTKMRLTSLVLFSAIAGYWLAVPHFDWVVASYIFLGGFLVTGAANGFNQIIEKDLDLLMARTQNRPIPQKRMSVNEGLIAASLMGIAGTYVLWSFLNPLTGILGAFAMVSYAAVYTPMKRVSPIAVYIGAIPGAIPPMIGYVAATGEMGLAPGILFLVQFAWQFPHFWAIAWKGDADYKKAGFKLLPTGKKDRTSSIHILISTLVLFPVIMLPYFFGIAGITSLIIGTMANLWFLYLAVKLYRTLADKDATKLMFASFIYLPIVLIAFVIDKI